jgi:hypothetical protein
MEVGLRISFSVGNPQAVYLMGKFNSSGSNFPILALLSLTQFVESEILLTLR